MNDDNVFDCDALKACCVDKDSNQAENGGFADDATWILTSSFVILTMQSGFGLLEMGSAMAGYEANIMMKNVADVLFGSLAYYLVGYGISFVSPSIPFMGLGDFLPDGATDANKSGFQFASYIFQFSFAATSTTIVSGCISMRMRFFVY
jgi:Amt family ammonium transporter